MSYGIITYVSAWLKTYHPLEYMANVLTNAYESNKDEKRIEEMVEECQRIGIGFLNVDASKSEWGFTVENGKIRIGLCAIKAFGDAAARSLINIRPFKSFEPVIEEYTTKGSKLNKKALTVLIFTGAFDDLDIGRDQMLYQMVYAKANKKTQGLMDDGKYDMPEDFTVCAGCTLNLSDSDIDTERKLLKVNYLHRPGANLAPIGFNKKEKGESFTGIVQISGVRRITDRRGQEMAFVELAASDCRIDGIIFGSTYQNLDESNVQKGKTVRIRARKDKEKENSCIIYELDAA